MSKNIYEKPRVLIEEFKEVEVLTTSIDDTDPADNNIEWGS